MYSLNMVALSIFAISLVGNAISDDKISLKLDLHTGQKFTCKQTMDLEAGQDGYLKGSFTINEETISTSETEIVSKVEMSNVKLTSTGLFAQTKETFSKMEGISWNRTLGHNLKSLKVAGIESNQISNTIDLVYADHPVGVGDTWDVTFQPRPTSPKITATFKLVSFDDAQTKIEAKIKPVGGISSPNPYVFIADRKTGHLKHAIGLILIEQAGLKLTAAYEQTFTGPL